MPQRGPWWPVAHDALPPTAPPSHAASRGQRTGRGSPPRASSGRKNPSRTTIWSFWVQSTPCGGHGRHDVWPAHGWMVPAAQAGHVRSSDSACKPPSALLPGGHGTQTPSRCIVPGGQVTVAHHGGGGGDGGDGGGGSGGGPEGGGTVGGGEGGGGSGGALGGGGASGSGDGGGAAGGGGDGGGDGGKGGAGGGRGGALGEKTFSQQPVQSQPPEASSWHVKVRARHWSHVRVTESAGGVHSAEHEAGSAGGGCGGGGGGAGGGGDGCGGAGDGRGGDGGTGGGGGGGGGASGMKTSTQQPVQSQPSCSRVIWHVVTW